MNDDLMKALVFALLAAFVGGWGSIWWRLGKMNGKMNGAMREWSALKRMCPLCPKTETKSEEELRQDIVSGRSS